MIQSAVRKTRVPRNEFTQRRVRLTKWSVVVFATLLLCNGPLPGQTEPVYKFFKGRVKSCNEQCYRAKGREGYIDKTVHKRPPNTGTDFEIHYDSLGKKLLRIEFEINGESVLRKHHYTYDGYNQLAEVRVLNKFGTLITSTRYLNSLDSSGRLLGRYVTYSDQSGSVGYTYSYSADGKGYEYFIPRNGSPQKPLPSREFDTAGHVTKYWSYTQSGKLIGYSVLSYDSLGNKIQEELFDKKGFNYLNYGWKYEGGHDPVRHEICRKNSTSCESWTYKYEYDKTGNWIQCTEYRNGKLMYVKERAFTYWN